MTGGDIGILEWVSGMLMEAMFSPRKEDLKDLAFRTSVQCNSTKSVKIGATVNQMQKRCS